MSGHDSQGRPKGSKNKICKTQIGSCQSLINDETRRYGVKIKFHKTAEVNRQPVIHQHSEMIHELQEDSIAADPEPAHSLDFSDDSTIHEDFLAELENIYLTSPTAVISSDLTLPPFKVASLV